MTDKQKEMGVGGDIEDNGSIESLKQHQRTAKYCPDCGALAYAYADNHRGEKICIACGFISDPQTTDSSRVKHNKPKQMAERQNEGKILIGKEEHQFLTRKEKHFKVHYLERKYDRDTEGEMKNHRYREYWAFADVCKTNYQMTPGQLEDVKNILNYFKMNGGLKKLHSRAASERIILALCILIMWRSGRSVDIQSDPYCSSIGLSKREYNIIIGNYMAHDNRISDFGVKEELI